MPRQACRTPTTLQGCLAAGNFDRSTRIQDRSLANGRSDAEAPTAVASSHSAACIRCFVQLQAPVPDPRASTACDMHHPGSPHLDAEAVAARFGQLELLLRLPGSLWQGHLVHEAGVLGTLLHNAVHPCSTQQSRRHCLRHAPARAGVRTPYTCWYQTSLSTVRMTGTRVQRCRDQQVLMKCPRTQ